MDIYFWVFSSSWMKKKRDMKKKKEEKRCRGAGLLPISSLCESRYSGLYRDTGGHRAMQAQPRHGWTEPRHDQEEGCNTAESGHDKAS